MKVKPFENKTIIISVPNHFELPNRFKENLEFLGFKVFSIENKRHSAGLYHGIIHAFKKNFLGDKSHKPKIKNKKSEPEILKSISSLKSADYALIIRPDLLSNKVIETIKSKVKKMVAYQWDGMERFAIDKSIIDYFDNFFIFDERDLEKYPQCKFLTNFYFDDLLETPTKIENDVFFVGTYMKNRIDEFLSLCKFFKKNQNIIDFYLKTRKKVKEFQNYNVKIVKKGISFTENILLLKKSKVLLDFKNDVHYGLSFRTFESIGYQKKLITNNELVKKYDFYNPNNIFVFKNNDFEGLKEFLETPYQDLPKEIYEKYSFSYWIKQILN